MSKPAFFRWKVITAAALAAGIAFCLPDAPRYAQTRVTIGIKEWTVPTPASHPHDPAVAPDGAAWYTGQAVDTLGRLDPLTGRFTEYPLPAGAGPHGLVADRDGMIWYTGNTAAHIGKLDPATGRVTPYRMPDARAGDPHTPIFDQQGLLWFTVQNGNFIGRLNPATGEVKLVPSKTANSRPYGIVVNARGVPFFDLFGANKLGSIDPQTLEITEYTLPNAAARPRRIAVTRDDIIWYTDYARGFLGRLEPATGRVTEFTAPAGARAQPYGITSTSDGALWFSESGVNPNTMVRFNPADGSMQSWPIPSGGGIVRHIVTAPNDDIWIACSGVNQLGRVTVSLPAAHVSAASYAAGEVAPESIVAAFGQRLATMTQAAATTPLPTELAGTRVSLRDSAGATRDAQLFFVSAAQINYLLPANLAPGAASVTITSGDGILSLSTVQIARVAPGVFTANADGRGVVAANVLRVKADGTQVYEAPAAVFDAAQNRFVARPIELGAAGEQVFLILYGSGWRQRSALSAVTARLGGEAAEINFAGAQGDLFGLDQINLLLPRALAGRGEVNLLLTVDGKSANPVTLKIG